MNNTQDFEKTIEFSVQLERNKNENEKSTKLQVTKLKTCEPEFKSNPTQKPPIVYPQVKISSLSEIRAEDTAEDTGFAAKKYPTVYPQIRFPVKSEIKADDTVKPNNPFRTAKEQLVSSPTKYHHNSNFL